MFSSTRPIGETASIDRAERYEHHYYVEMRNIHTSTNGVGFRQ